MYTRETTKKILIKNVQIGHQTQVVIQSMTNKKTSNIDESLKQIQELAEAGCQLVRVAILDLEDVKALKQLNELSPIPIIADIHFNYLFAIQAIENGCKKIRINPGNIGSLEQVKKIIATAKKYDAAIRIGFNTGSLPKSTEKAVDAIIHELKKWITFFENEQFDKLVISLKSSNLFLTEKLYLKASEFCCYPLHLGVTEAGTTQDAIIKTTLGLGNLLRNNIGDTIRVSISGDPIQEVYVAKKLLHFCNIKQLMTEIIACPTCGRNTESYQRLLAQIIELTNKYPKQIKVAMMGCLVNGIGESKDADIGLFCLNNGKINIYVDGKEKACVANEKAFDTFKEIYLNYIC